MTPTAITRKKLTDLLDGAFLARLDGLDVVSRKMLQGKMQGERRSKRRGEGVEFADHRPYVVGDDLRFVDWNIFARLDGLFLKLFLEEQDLSVHVMYDFSASMDFGEPTKAVAVQKLAAALAYVGIVNNNRVTVSRFGDGLAGQLANMRGRSYTHLLAEFLLATDPGGPSDFDKACRQIANARTGRGIMVVLSDFMFKSGYEQGLRRLISRQYDLFIVHVLSPQEMEPELTGDLKLVDMEDGDQAEITVSGPLLKYYKKNLAAYCNELKDFCTHRGARYLLARTSDNTEVVVLNALRRGGLLT